MTKQDKKIEQAINLILKDIKKNAISNEHRCDELNIGCAECQFRLLEMYLEMYKDIILTK